MHSQTHFEVSTGTDMLLVHLGEGEGGEDKDEFKEMAL